MQIEIVQPASNTGHQAGDPFVVIATVQANPPPEQGVATIQFSNDADGPWTTCRPLGEAGAVSANPASWESQQEQVEIEAALTETAYIRVGIWPDQALSGPPLSEPSPPIIVRKIAAAIDPE